MTGRSRRRLRALVFIAIGGMLAAVWVAFARRLPANETMPVIAPVNGWAAKGIRFARDGEHGARMHVSAGGVATSPVRMGVFSIGFLQRIEASDVEVDVDLGAARDPHDLDFDLDGALRAIAGPGAAGKRFASGRILGLRVRVRAPDQGAVEVRAGRCDVRPSLHRRVHLGDHVLIRAGETNASFTSLVYDPGARRFAAEDGVTLSPLEQRALDDANDELRRLVEAGASQH